MKEKGVFSLILVLLVAACLPSLAPAPHTAAPATHTLAPSVTTPAPTIQNTNGIPIAAAPSSQSYAYLPITRSPAARQAIVADHSVLSQFGQIPQTAIAAAAARKTLFMHQSTGGLIDDSGLGCLAGLHDDPQHYPPECGTYAANRTVNRWPWYDKSNWSWDFWPDPQADAIAKTDQFVNVVHARAANYQIIGMKYCYVDGWNQSENVTRNYYIEKMLALESEYPGKTFIWATSALWQEPASACGGLFDSCEQIAQFNQQVRAYALAHNKPLYDVADIESHDQNGSPCVVGGYEGMCAQWYDSGGGHPNTAGSIRLAKGFWWLMARISGWSGTSSSNP